MTILRSPFILLLCLLPSLSSCTRYLMDFEITKRYFWTINVNEDASFSREVIITKNDILNALDIPETATIKKIHVGAKPVPVVIVKELEGDEVELINFTADIKDGSSTTYTPLIKTTPVPVDNSSANTVLTGFLLTGGVNKLTQKINEFKDRSNFNNDNFTLRYKGEVPVNFFGTKMNFNLTIGLSLVIEYEDCVTAPFGMMGGEEECDL